MTNSHIIAKLKSFIILPPNINRANKAKIVVAVVFIVLDKVSLIDLLVKKMCLVFKFFKFSHSIIHYNCVIHGITYN